MQMQDNDSQSLIFKNNNNDDNGKWYALFCNNNK